MSHTADRLFYASLSVIVVFRLFLTWDQDVLITYSPHDDSLYVARAFSLISGEGFGEYDSRILSKYPGLSIGLAGLEVLNVPYLLLLNVLYLASGVYALVGLLRCGIGRATALAAFLLYALNPVTYGDEWLRVLREPLDTVLLVIMVGGIAHLLATRKFGWQTWLHLLLFAAAFAFSMFLREENRLLWAFLALCVGGFAWQSRRTFTAPVAASFVVATLIVPLVLANGYEYALRQFVAMHYGSPILHDFGEGEFARMLAAIRSIESTKDNRLVMVTQERLEKLRKTIPAFAPIVDELPKPGPATYSCKRQGVCSEWANGWMPFWIKDEAFQAGLTPSLTAAQEYFHRVRVDIEAACADGRLRCQAKGDGILPPMELRWTRAYVAEGYRLVLTTLQPEVYPKLQVETVDPSGELRRIYGTVLNAERQDSRVSKTLDGLRRSLVPAYQGLGAVLLVVAVLCLGLRLWIADRVPLGPVALVGVIAGLYGVLRLAVLTYVAVFFGPFTGRIIFSTYVVSLLIALPLIAETLSAWRRSMRVAVR